jgi:hypothetical protein
MSYWVKRILLRTGELVTERELRPDENLFDGRAPMAGDKLIVACRGRTFEAKVLVGRFAGRPEPEANEIYPIRVEEV